MKTNNKIENILDMIYKTKHGYYCSYQQRNEDSRPRSE